MKFLPWAAVLLVTTGACDLADLTHAQLYGAVTPVGDAGPRPPAPDAGDAAPDAHDAGPAIYVSGAVTNACTGDIIDALVGIAGRHTCSFAGKGSFFIRIDDVPAGVTVTLTAAKKGYHPYSAQVVLDRSGVPHDIALVPDPDCASNPRPATEACVCQLPSCVQP
jgi:hypothetical protein